MLVDLSHDQAEWDYGAPSIFRVASGALDAFLSAHLDLSSFEMKEIRDRRQLNATEMKAWQGLVLGIPSHVRMEDATRYDIVQWVRSGGRLVLLGFELGERHHETNLNALADAFGLRFNSDIVAPRSWTGTGKPYDEPIEFTGIQSAHPVMAGVQNLRLWNLCTLTPEPGADLVLALGENGIASLQRQGVNYTSKGWLRGGKQVFSTNYGVGWVPVIAEAPHGLTGQGRVLAIGTWVLFQQNPTQPPGFDTARFLANLLAWCAAQ
ncbi:MAG: hypothetical protein IPK16_12620 [Anaerolineales bacterium]|nr:hypothetical protein [Anaerolineales bacterium]